MSHIHIWMISAKGIKPNDKTLPMYSLSLYNFDQNIRFSKHLWVGTDGKDS